MKAIKEVLKKVKRLKVIDDLREDKQVKVTKYSAAETK